MRLKQLVCFATAAKESSITRASETLQISQPAVGMQIRSLEEYCGIKLIKGHSRGITLTPAGEVLARRAEEVLDLMNIVEMEIAQLRDAESSVIRLGITPSICDVIISDLLELGNARHPQAKILFSQGFVEEIHRLWDSGEIDLLFTSRTDKSSQAERIPLFWEQFYLIGNPKIIQPLPDPVPIACLADLPLVFDGREVELLNLIEQELQAQGRQLADRIKVPTHSIRKEYVIMGLRCCIAPFAFLINKIESGDCAAVPIDHPFARRLMHLVGPGPGDMRASVVGIRDIILDLVQDHVKAGNYGWIGPSATD